MIYGHVRDYLPRVTLTLPGLSGPLTVEFILDTAFEGELALPASLAHQLDGSVFIPRTVRLADGSLSSTAFRRIVLDWNDEPRPTEVLVLEGSPLLGMLILEGNSLYVEAHEGGEVVIEPL